MVTGVLSLVAAVSSAATGTSFTEVTSIVIVFGTASKVPAESCTLKANEA